MVDLGPPCRIPKIRRVGHRADLVQAGRAACPTKGLTGGGKPRPYGTFLMAFFHDYFRSP